MAEYIEREAFAEDIRESYCKLKEIFETLRYERERDICNGELGTFCEILMRIKCFPAADVVPVVHGRWVECDDEDCDSLEDAYNHHKCTNCNTVAPYGYKYREDCDEGMDGEWYSLGIIDDGIIEHLTPYCPNCGAHMKDGE